MRRPKFEDGRVREALGYTYDFDTINKTGVFTRASSVFNNSEFAAQGVPGPGELKLLEPESKDVVSKTTNKEDAMIDLDMEDKLADFRSLGEFAVTARGLVRSWKAFAHAANDKSRSNFLRCGQPPIAPPTPLAAGTKTHPAVTKCCSVPAPQSAPLFRQTA